MVQILELSRFGQVRKSQIGKLRSGELRVAWIGSLGLVRTKIAV